jgi:hypothetical protein
MNLKRTFNPILLCVFLSSLACVTLTAPFGARNNATEPPAEQTVVVNTEVVPENTPTRTPTSKPTVIPTTAPTAALPPTATLHPEKQTYFVTDETGAIEANIPTVWTDLRTEPWVNEKGEKVGTIFTASTDIEAFLKFQAEGVSISVSHKLPVGYIQLLETEYERYIKQCEDTYLTRWKVEDPVYQGLNIVFGDCAETDNTWLSLFTLVDKRNPSQYIARLVAYDMIPIYGEDFRTMLLKFKVHPENLQ